MRVCVRCALVIALRCCVAALLLGARSLLRFDICARFVVVVASAVCEYALTTVAIYVCQCVPQSPRSQYRRVCMCYHVGVREASAACVV